LKTIVNHITIQVVTYLVICAIGVLLLNTAVYTHTHKLADGTFITHAHPYNKSTDDEPFKSHHHTKAESIFFEALGMFFPILFLSFILYQLSQLPLKVVFVNLIYEIELIKFSKGRSPPVF
jgi:hypothetical protein